MGKPSAFSFSSGVPPVIMPECIMNKQLNMKNPIGFLQVSYFYLGKTN